MVRQSTRFVLIAFAAVLIAAGCSPQVAPPPPPAPTMTEAVTFPLGVFTKANWTLEFKADGTLTLKQQFVNDVGNYSVTGDQVVFSSNELSKQKCDGAPGAYTWAYDGQVLSFRMINDKCMDRRNILDRSKWQTKP